jgi:tryptophan synthase alpha chain
MPFLTAGLPTIESSVERFSTMAEAGADAFEIGIPYADPLMDGPTIQRASELARSRGTTMTTGLELTKRVVETTGKPAIVMTYVNPILAMGTDVFMAQAAAAGAVAIIVADLPFEESAPFAAVAKKHGLGLAQFVAPTTPESRVRDIVSSEPPFVYAIADMGVTGERSDASSHTGDLIRLIRSISSVPIVLGVGISTPDQAREAGQNADGVIVGSAIVRVVLDQPDDLEALAKKTSALATAVHGN